MRSFSSLFFFLFLYIFSYYPSIYGQALPDITPDEIPGYEITRNECFDGGSLWGYMNGGADIYLEYGFESLRVQEFNADGENIKLELYKMNDPLSAFGIYSIKTFKCIQANMKVIPDCLNRYQYQAVCGRYYVQIINESGSEAVKSAMEVIASGLLNKMESAGLHLPITYLNDSLHFPINEIKMVKGELGLQTKVVKLAPFLNDLSGYQVYYAKKVVDEKPVKYIEVVFNNIGQKSIFFENIAAAGYNIIGETQFGLLIQQ